MTGRLVQAWEAVRASYWFVPSLMAVAAVLLAGTAVRAESSRAAAWLNEAGWLYANQPDGARALLSTVAGSMITVGGVTFSMTIVAIAHASSQIGPRLLPDFMRDRGTQLTLGTFIATFLYCLLVLRTVHGADEGGTGGGVEEFVPQLAIFGAQLLAMLSVGVLIYFIHHVPQSLSMAHLIDGVSHTLHDRIRCLYPEPIGAPSGTDTDTGTAGDGSAATPDLEGVVLLDPQRRGYIQYVDEARLMGCAERADLVVRLLARPGDFVGPCTELARVTGPAEALSDETRRTLLEAFACGNERTPRQDVLFPALQLVEVAVRALSPGTNDPFTAVRCIDHLLVALDAFVGRGIPDPWRTDAQGRPRVFARSVSFEELADAIFDGLRPFVSQDALCTVHLLRGAVRLSHSLEGHANRAVLLRHADALRSAAETEIRGSRDLALVRAAASRGGS